MTESEKKAWEFAEKVLGVAHEAVRRFPKDWGAAQGDMRDVKPGDRAADYVSMTEEGLPPVYSVEERRVRAEVASRLWAMLRVKTPVDPSLEAALSQMENHIAHGGRGGAALALIEHTARAVARSEIANRFGPFFWPNWAEMDPKPDAMAVLNAMDVRLKAWDSSMRDVRDAALEEVASADFGAVEGFAQVRVRDAIRALKSNPAPLCLTPGCEKPTGHVPPCEPCGARPEPTHDFGISMAEAFHNPVSEQCGAPKSFGTGMGSCHRKRGHIGCHVYAVPVAE